MPTSIVCLLITQSTPDGSRAKLRDSEWLFVHRHPEIKAISHGRTDLNFISLLKVLSGSITMSLHHHPGTDYVIYT